MSEIERRVTSNGLANIGMAPSQDPNEIDWVPIEEWNWKTFGDLPESVVASLSASGLLPSNIILENFPAPNERVVDGWLIGPNGFSLFKIIPAGTNKWSVIGGFTAFKSNTMLITDNLKSDLASKTPSSAASNSASGITLSDKLKNAEVLPESLRKKLNAIKSPKHENSNIYSFGGGPGSKFNHRVDAIVVNATQIFAVKAVQEIEHYSGESEAAARQRLSLSPWSVEMIYEKFA